MIKNKVATSGLISLDIEKLYTTKKAIVFDVKDFLWKGIVLKEKEFRTALKNYNWENLADKNVAIYCSVDAIIPSWAYMLVTSYLLPFGNRVVYGDLKELEKEQCKAIIQKMDTAEYENKRVIVKGCSQIPTPELAMVEITKKLQPIVKSLMFGEACSSVPIYKR